MKKITVNTRLQSVQGRVKIDIDLGPAADRMAKAQKVLDKQVLSDCEPFVPKRAGMLRTSGINNTVCGSGEVIWQTPYAHYMYQGKTMVGMQTKSAWANKDEPKVYDGGRIVYHMSGTGAKWFEKAKRRGKGNWVKLVKRTLKEG